MNDAFAAKEAGKASFTAPGSTGTGVCPRAPTTHVKPFFRYIAAHEHKQVARGKDTIPGLERYLREREVRMAAHKGHQHKAH